MAITNNGYDRFFSLLRENLNLRTELLKSDSLILVSKVFSDLVTNLVMSVFLLLAFIFGTVTLGFFFSDLLDSFWAGFGCLTVFYVLVAMVMLSRNSLLEKLLINFSLRRLLDKHLSHEK